jgi:hypothetical protein
MDKYYVFVPTILAVLAMVMILPSIQPQTSKASTCSASASFGGIQRIQTNARVQGPSPIITSQSGCASSSGAIGGPFGGSAATGIAGNPSACSVFSATFGESSSHSGSTVSCSLHSLRR